MNLSGRLWNLLKRRRKRKEGASQLDIFYGQDIIYIYVYIEESASNTTCFNLLIYQTKKGFERNISSQHAFPHG